MRPVDFFFTAVQFVIPQHALSRLVHGIARSRQPLLKRVLIKCFIKAYGIDMSIAVQPNPERYSDFNSFFTRALLPRARPIHAAPGDLVCPVDGTISQLGAVDNGRLFQAKDRNYSLDALLGDLGSTQFQDGSFITLYLSPKDYHRVHMPIAGRLRRSRFVPGKLFAVNPRTVSVVDGLFAKNERLIHIFDTEAGPMALIMVGAIFVGSMETTWQRADTKRMARKIANWHYPASGPDTIKLAKAEEMGRFNMGSTVILLFGKNTVRWDEALSPGQEIAMGQRLATVIRPPAPI